MTTERRTNARGHAQQRVTFTNAADDAPLEGALHDVGRGGMFIVTPKPLPIGKRIDFEVHVEGGATIAGMARVIWVRESAAGDLPAGMGLKFIDVDNDALLAIDRLVGLKKNVRERTVLGMAAPKPPEAKAPEPTVKKIRERTMLGIAPPPGPAREQELSWPEEPPAPPPEPVVAKEAEPVKEPEPEPVKEPEPEPVKEPEPEPVKEPEPEPVKEPEPEPVKEPEPKAEVAVAEEVEGPPPARELPKRESGGGRGWMVGVLLIVVLGVVGFVFRDQIMAIVSPPTTPSASASTSAAPPASSSAMPSALPPASVEPAIVDVVDAAADIAPTDASVTTSTLDASMHDGGHEGGHHKLDAGPHHVHEHAHVAPSATHAAAGTDNPY